MFTGIIIEQGKITNKHEYNEITRLTIQAKKVIEGVEIGDSIAVNGVCLTVVAYNENSFDVECMSETMNVTNFKELDVGHYVNLETSLAFNEKLSGHIVYGDVDCVGMIINKEYFGESIVYTFSFDRKWSKYLIDKGRITIDGASLTSINTTEPGKCSVAFIPHSLKVLTISKKDLGESVNLEFDVYAKHVYKMIKGDYDE